MSTRIQSQLDNKIFQPAEKVLGLGSTLLRLVKLNLTMERSLLAKVEGVVTDNWASFFKERNTGNFHELVLRNFTKKLSGTHESDVIEPIAQLFEEEIAGIKTDADGLKWQTRFKKDLETISLLPPLYKTENGDEGPTYLVEYSRIKRDHQLPRLHAYVIKWTNWNEIQHNRIYQVFADLFQTTSLRFYVPAATAFDFQDRLHLTHDGNKQTLTQELTDRLYQSFHRIVELRKDNQNNNAQQLALFQKVEGQDLLAFASSRYSTLSVAQRENFFKQLAAISMIDILLGHNDRIVHLDYDHPTPFTLPQEWGSLDPSLQANLGNIMVCWKPHETDPAIYAIDNGIEIPLTTPAYEERHVAFLGELLRAPDLENQLASNMSACLLKAVKIYLHELEDDVSFSVEFAQNSADLEPFLSDLQDREKVHNWLRRGLKEAISLIQQKLPKSRGLEKIDELLSRVSTNFRQIFPLISQKEGTV